MTVSVGCAQLSALKRPVLGATKRTKLALLASATNSPQLRSRLGLVPLIGTVFAPSTPLTGEAHGSNGGGGLPKVTVSVPLFTWASWVVSPPSLYDS